MAAGSGAMAQSRYYGGDWMAAAGPVGIVGPHGSTFNYSNPYDAYDASDAVVPFGGARPWGTAVGSSSQSYYNPAMDRAKGNIGGN